MRFCILPEEVANELDLLHEKSINTTTSSCQYVKKIFVNTISVEILYNKVRFSKKREVNLIKAGRNLAYNSISGRAVKLLPNKTNKGKIMAQIRQYVTISVGRFKE